MVSLPDASEHDLTVSQRFYRQFHGESEGWFDQTLLCWSSLIGLGEALQARMEQLKTSAVDDGEKANLIENCGMELSRLSDAVMDASHSIPTYDQRTYAEVAGSAIGLWAFQAQMLTIGHNLDDENHVRNASKHPIELCTETQI